MVSEKEIEAEMIGWQHALSAAARVREEDNAKEPAVSVETPERIWIESEGGCPYFYHEEELSDVDSPVTEYVRADKLEELLKKQEELSAEVERVRDGNRYAHLEQIAIKLVNKAEAALAERDKEVAELREALRDIVDTGGISVGNAAINHMITINYMVSIARRALEGGE